MEQEVLGFTHCDTGRVLADIWKLPPDISETIEFHHLPAASMLDAEMTCVVYLADVFCRLRGLGYGYYEAREFDLAAEVPWQMLQKRHPSLSRGWTWRDLPSSWTNTDLKCKPWWIRSFPSHPCLKERTR